MEGNHAFRGESLGLRLVEWDVRQLNRYLSIISLFRGRVDLFHEVVEGTKDCVGSWQEGTDFSVIVT